MPIDYTGSADYKANVRIKAVTDAALGGVDGQANLSSQDLADRTAYLKQEQDTLKSYDADTRLNTLENRNSSDIGSVVAFATDTPPANYLKANGASLDRVTYADLFDVCKQRFSRRCMGLGGFPDFAQFKVREGLERNFILDSIINHGYSTGLIVRLDNYAPDVNEYYFPGPIVIDADTDCYVRVVDSDIFTLHPTLNDAINDTNAAIAEVTNEQSYMTVDLSDVFALPDMRGYFPRGVDDGRLVDPDGNSRVVGTKQDMTTEKHVHPIYTVQNGTIGAGGTALLEAAESGSSLGFGTGENQPNSPPPETRPWNLALLYCIKYQ
jgi:hypothetical protein